jgi:transcriptional regulator
VETRTKEAVAAVERKAKEDLDRANKQIEALKTTGSKVSSLLSVDDSLMPDCSW